MKLLEAKKHVFLKKIRGTSNAWIS
jgi:hypothetical protein